jgi:Raf kinase inhibitor-like YbhB/YbcL family protein
MSAAVLVTLSLTSSAYAQNAPPAGALPPGAGLPADFVMPPFAAPLLVPNMAATIDVEVPGGLQGPQGSIRLKYSRAGANLKGAGSPPLTWTPGPKGTKSYAVIMQDIGNSEENPTGFPHWTILDIPASVTKLPAAIPEGMKVPGVPGARQMTSGPGTKLYTPPGRPPNGSNPVTPVLAQSQYNIYTIQVFALDSTVNVADDAKTQAVLEAMKGHVLAYGMEPVMLQEEAGRGRAPGGPPGAAPANAPAPGRGN